MIAKKPKTEVYAVTNRNSGYVLGVVRWHGPWRRYCFFPSGDTVFSLGCLEDIGLFIRKLMKERKSTGAPKCLICHKPFQRESPRVVLCPECENKDENKCWDI